MNRPLSNVLVSALVAASLSLIGCAGGAAGPGAATIEEKYVVHTVTPEDKARLSDTTPLKADRVRLYVNGMGCPLCVTNVDKQLARLKGVQSSKVNLGDGTVDIELIGRERPSPARLARAVDGDFTLVKLEELP